MAPSKYRLPGPHLQHIERWDEPYVPAWLRRVLAVLDHPAVITSYCVVIFVGLMLV